MFKPMILDRFYDVLHSLCGDFHSCGPPDALINHVQHNVFGRRTCSHRSTEWRSSTLIEEEVDLHALVKANAEPDCKFDIRGSASPHAADTTSGYNLRDQLEGGIRTSHHLKQAKHLWSRGMIPAQMYAS